MFSKYTQQIDPLKNNELSSAPLPFQQFNQSTIQLFNKSTLFSLL